jgi:transcriptional regulator with XRE-family HTH domain
MTTLSKGASNLRAKLSPIMSQTELAKRLGVSQQAVSAWLKGRALPEPERMAAIEEILGIPMRDWVEASAESADDSGEHAAVVDATDAA